MGAGSTGPGKSETDADDEVNLEDTARDEADPMDAGEFDAVPTRESKDLIAELARHEASVRQELFPEDKTPRIEARSSRGNDPGPMRRPTPGNDEPTRVERLPLVLPGMAPRARPEPPRPAPRAEVAPPAEIIRAPDAKPLDDRTTTEVARPALRAPEPRRPRCEAPPMPELTGATPPLPRPAFGAPRPGPAAPAPQPAAAIDDPWSTAPQPVRSPPSRPESVRSEGLPAIEIVPPAAPIAFQLRQRRVLVAVGLAAVAFGAGALIRRVRPAAPHPRVVVAVAPLPPVVAPPAAEAALPPPAADPPPAEPAAAEPEAPKGKPGAKVKKIAAARKPRSEDAAPDPLAAFSSAARTRPAVSPPAELEPGEPLPAPVPREAPRPPALPPSLPQVVVTESSDRVAVLCRDIEAAAIAQGGVSADFARNITDKLRRAIRPNTPIYPTAIYNFIVKEAAAKRDRSLAASNLAAAHTAGRLRD